MKKKIVVIILIILFVALLIVVNTILNIQDNIYEEAPVKNEINYEEEKKVEILKVTSSNFDKEVLESKETVLIDFYADWCGPCKMLSLVIEEVAKENTDIKFVKVNIDDEQDLSIEYGVMSIPTLIVIKDGEEVNRTVGVISKSEILKMIK